MSKLAQKIDDARVLKLIRRYLEAGMMQDGVVSPGSEGFKLTEAKQALEELDGWIRRKLRCVLWRQWKRPATRRRCLIQRGLPAERAWRSAYNQRGHGRIPGPRI